MFQSPFQILGIPQEIVDLEVQSNNPERLKALVEGVYKNLTKLYHPDRGGDSDMFARLTLARDEILDDPMSCALFFSKREGREFWSRKLIIQRERDLKSKEKSAIFRLLSNINPKKVTPWLSDREAVIGNLAFGEIGKSMLIVASLSETQMRLKIAVSNYDGRRFFYSRVADAWKVSTTGQKTNKPSTPEVVRPFSQTSLYVVGGLSEAHISTLMPSFLRDTDNDDVRDENLALESSGKPGRLLWTPISDCTWLDKIKPVAGRDDYLVLMSSKNDAVEPRITIIGPVFKIRKKS